MIQLAKPMGTAQPMQGPLYRTPAMPPQQETLADRLKRTAMEKAMSKGEEALLEKAGAKTVAAAGAAMGDPTGGIATEVAYEAAMPMLRSLLGGLFNKGGYVNGPLSAAQLIEQDRAIAAEKVRAAQQKAAYNQRLREQAIIDQKVALDRLKADQAWARQGMELDSTLADIDYQTRGLMADPLYKSHGGPLASKGV